ncbi:MAG: hypothetical protein WBM46_19250 [Polyangiales bacterium]
MSIVWTAIVLSACSEGGADGVGSDTFVDGALVCHESRTPIGGRADMVAELGFRADDVLAFSATEHQGMLRWLPTQALTYGPESGDVTLSVAIDYAGGPIELVQSTRALDADPPPGVDVVPLEGGCFDALAIEVELEITTAGGALAERFTTEMRARTAQTANILRQLDLDALDGTFEVTAIEGSGSLDAEPDSIELQPRLWIEFSELGSQGRLDAKLFERYGGSGGVVVFHDVALAHWPADEL